MEDGERGEGGKGRGRRGGGGEGGRGGGGRENGYVIILIFAKCIVYFQDYHSTHNIPFSKQHHLSTVQLPQVKGPSTV